MRHEDEESARLWSKSPQYRKREAAALAIVEKALRDHAPLYVAFSGGKDSAAMASLVRDIEPNIELRTLLWPESELLANHGAVIDAWRERQARITVLHLTRDGLDDAVKDRWKQLADLSPANGCFVGLRAEESAHRAWSLGKHGAVHVYKTGPCAGQVRVAPLLRWTAWDVAARIYLRDLPILDAYDERGIETRTSSRVPRASVRPFLRADMQESRPGAWQQLVMMFPELAD